MFEAFVLDANVCRGTRSYDEVAQAHAAGKTLWVRILSQDEETDRLLAEVFEIHALGIEDIWHDRHFPKVEDLDDYLQMLVHSIRADTPAGEVELSEIDLVLGHNFLLSHAHDEGVHESLARELLKNPKLLARGPAWVAHAILDRVVDEFLPYIDRYEEAIGEIEESLIPERHPRESDLAPRIFFLMRGLQRFRRSAQLQREVLLRLARMEFDELPVEARPFFRDVYDHLARVTELSDSARETLTGLLEVSLSLQSARMNDIMKTLTLMSTVMLPLTFVAGVYGMNFDHMPELHWLYGYPAALGLMLVITVLILGYFRARRWI